MTTADVVVAGAGHNSLITAAYLAAGGLRGARARRARRSPAAGRRARSCSLPGFRIDSCSTGHTLIQTNPLLLDDELGLQADYGLEYLEPDPFAHVAFPDGTHLTMWLDRRAHVRGDRALLAAPTPTPTAALLAEYDEVKGDLRRGDVHAARLRARRSSERLAEHPRGRVWQRRRR